LKKREIRDFIYLTPFVPLSFEGEGDFLYQKRGFAPLRHP